jgi:hypothetical protein
LTFQNFRKIAPMTPFSGQSTEQYPAAHEEAFPYQCCMACSRYTSRLSPVGIHSR